MLITKLTVVNACLASMGEEPINSLAAENAFINSAKFALEQSTLNEQSIGWYYNTERLQLLPDTEGKYVVPSDIIDLNINHSPGWLTVRKSRLYNTDCADYIKGTAPFTANVIRLLDFEDLPLMAQRLVKAASVIFFQQSYDGDELKIREAQMEYSAAYTALRTQHIKAVGANFGTSAIRAGHMLGGGLRLPVPR